MTGLWRLHIELASNPGYLLDLTSHFLQSGTSLSNDLVDPGEACDDGNLDDGDCCSADCQQVVADGMPCEDGAFCDGTDTCAGGTCSAHTGNPCPAGNVCDHTCNESVHSCNATLRT